MNVLKQPMLSRPHGGFTIIEFLIASLIGSTLIIIIFNIFVSSYRSQTYVKQLVELEANSQAGLLFIARSIELAGYTEAVNASLTRDILFPKNALFAVGQAIAVADDGDRLYVRMYGGSLGIIKDCEGDPVGLNTLSTKEITIVDHRLICRDLGENLKFLESTVIAHSAEHIEFVAKLRRADDPNLVKSVLNSSQTEQDLLLAVSVEYISRSSMEIREKLKKTQFTLVSGEQVSWSDKYYYLKSNRVISTKNIGKSVELS